MKRHKVFAIDFFDDALWSKVVSSAHGPNFLKCLFFCQDCCKKNTNIPFFKTSMERIVGHDKPKRENIDLTVYARSGKLR
jgi:hypothetical protein